MRAADEAKAAEEAVEDARKKALDIGWAREDLDEAIEAIEELEEDVRVGRYPSNGAVNWLPDRARASAARHTARILELGGTV